MATHFSPWNRRAHRFALGGFFIARAHPEWPIVRRLAGFGRHKILPPVASLLHRF